MHLILLNLVGFLSLTLADDNFIFNQNAFPFPDYASFNPYSVQPAKIVQPPYFPRNLVAGSVQPADYGSGERHFSDVVRTFANNFVQRILSSPVYTDAFALHKVSRETATKLFYDYIYDLNKERGDRDPEFSAYTASQALKNNYDSTTTVHFIQVHGYTVGQLMYVTGQLTAENALKLSDEYFRDTASAIDAVVVNSPQEKLGSVMTGLRNFLTTYGVYSGLAFTVPSVFYQVYYTLNE